jgi:O-antigen/teichoic acid export membrane protein
MITGNAADRLLTRIGLGGRVVRNSAFLFSANAGAKAIAFLLNALILWKLTDDDFSAYRWAVAWVGILANFVEFGMLRVGVRAIARSPGQAAVVFRALTRVKAVLALITGIVLIITLELFFFHLEQFPLLRVLSYIWFLVVIAHVLKKNHEAVFGGLERMGWIALFTFFNRLANLALVFVLLENGGTIVGVFFVFLGVELFELAVQAWVLRRMLRRDLPGIVAAFEAKDEATRQELLDESADGEVAEAEELAPPENYERRSFGTWLREATPFGLQELSGEVYMRFDTVMLGALVSAQAVADYNKAYLILTALLVLPAALSQAVFPQLSAMHRRNPAEMKRYFRQNYLIMVSIGPLVAAAFWLASPLILWVMRGKVPEVQAIYKVAMLTIPFYFLTMPLVYFLGAIFQQRYVTVVSIAMALFNIVANLMVIPHYGALGAAGTTLATEALALLLFCSYLQRHHGGLFHAKGLLALVVFHGFFWFVLLTLHIDARGFAIQFCYAFTYAVMTAAVVLFLRRETLKRLRA